MSTRGPRVPRCPRRKSYGGGMGTGDLGVVVGGAAQIDRLDVADDRGRTDAEAGFDLTAVPGTSEDAFPACGTVGEPTI